MLMLNPFRYFLEEKKNVFTTEDQLTKIYLQCNFQKIF